MCLCVVAGDNVCVRVYVSRVDVVLDNVLLLFVWIVNNVERNR